MCGLVLMTRRTLPLQQKSKIKKHPSKKHFFGGGGMGNFFFFSFSFGIYEYIYVVYIRYISFSFFRGCGGPFISFFLFLFFFFREGGTKSLWSFQQNFLIPSDVPTAVENLVSSVRNPKKILISCIFQKIFLSLQRDRSNLLDSFS